MKLTAQQIDALRANGNTAEDWGLVEVGADFDPAQVVHCRLEGVVHIGSGARLVASRVRNYRIGAGAFVGSVTSLECRHASTFGGGVRVAALNENGGRSVPIYNELTAQVAYVLALYRHRPKAVAAIRRMIERQVQSYTIGEVGAGARIVGARFIREVNIGENGTIEGTSLLENGTVCAGARIGIDVQARDFIVAEDARVEGGTIVERCFVGERCVLDKHFTAIDSLFFANCHCENGEAVSIFAGPCTVSHHKASLLIAGLFSFFNAGSAANQSNHLFKSGAVHQAIHRRGCKFGSGTYIMAPAAEGPFTLVLGHHTRHHDTSAFPYSYLVEQDGRSVLMPAANLVSAGTVRDIAKWPARDRRTVGRDRINFEEHNPYIAGGMVEAVNILNTLDTENYHRVTIPEGHRKRGLKRYNKAIVASLGAMLSRGEPGRADGRGRWNDMAGQYVPRREADRLLDAIEHGEIASLEAIEAQFTRIAADYDHYARSWAEALLTELLGHPPCAEEIAEAIKAGERTEAELKKTAEEDRARDFAPSMAVGYGIDTDLEEEKLLDYQTVRNV